MSRELCNESTGPNQTGALTKQQFLEVSVDLLGKHSWLYDFQMTEIFCHNLLEDNFPSSWLDFFRRTSFAQLDTLILSESIPDTIDLPTDLRNLLEQLKCLECQSRPIEYSGIVRSKLEKQFCVGLSPKKQHEIETMMPFIRELCRENYVQTLVDIGSGLGYFDKHLARNSEIRVVGVERKGDFVEGANKRQIVADKTDMNQKIVNISYTVHENSEQELITLVNKAQPAPGNLGLISLHSCGDLTPAMLKIFAANQSGFKMLVAFSCCYHAMQSDDENNFKQFPMSTTLRTILDKHNFELSIFALRLACQQDISTLIGKSDEEHHLHVKQVAYRAILQKFCLDRNLKIKKLKRKLAGKSEFESFQHYVDFVNDRIIFEDSDENTVPIKNLPEVLTVYYNKYEEQLSAIEPLTYLQLMIQPIIERLILTDRICFLDEQKPGTTNSLVKVFESHISPRCVCILSQIKSP